MRNIYNPIILLILLVVVLSSCTKDDQDEVINAKGNSITIKLTVPDLKEIKAATENGETSLNENKVNTLDVFIYEENTDACMYYERIIVPPAVANNGTYSKVIAATQEQFTLNANHSIYVVANYTGTIASGGIALTALKALSISSLNSDKLQDSFIMDGVTSMILNNAILVNKEIPVTLQRAAAKIRVTANYALGFTLIGTSIYKKMIKYASNSTLIAGGNTITPTLEDMAGFTTQTTGAGNATSIIAYSYANSWNNLLSNETYIVVNVPIRVGTTNYDPNYYKIPVNYRLPSNGDDSNLTDAQKQALYKIERNKLYSIAMYVDKIGSTNPGTPVTLTANYTIQEWTTKDVVVEVNGTNFLYVKDKDINLPNSTTFTTTFQSSKPDVQIKDISVNGTPSANGANGVTITCTANAKSGDISINSTLPINFVVKSIKFTVFNSGGLSQVVTVSQYPSVYLSANTSGNVPGGSDGQNNANMYITTLLVPNFSMFPNPDEFDEVFDTGFSHFAPNPTLGISYANYIRTSAVMGFPLTDANGYTIDTEENNRCISPRYILASQYGVTGAASYVASQTKCANYSEIDATTNQTYTDWRMPTLAEIYAIDVLQNVKQSQVKKILEGPYYWSASSLGAVNFMDPRVGNSSTYNKYSAAVRCVRDIK